MAYTEKDIAKRRQELQRGGKKFDSFAYQGPNNAAPTRTGTGAASTSGSSSSRSSGSRTGSAAGPYTEDMIKKRREERTRGRQDTFAYQAPDFSVLPTPKINPFRNVTYQNPAAQAMHQQTGWMDPTTKALWDIANQSIGKQGSVSPSTLHAVGGLQFDVQNNRDKLNSMVQMENRRQQAEDRRNRQQEAFDNAKTRADNARRTQQVSNNPMRPSYVVKNSDGTNEIHRPTSDDIRPWESIQEAPIASIVSGVTNGSGVPSFGYAVSGAFANATGNERLKEAIRRDSMNEALRSQQAQERHPLAYGAGSIAGNLGLMTATGAAVNAIGGAVLGARNFGKIGNAALRMGTGALNFAATTAVQESGAAVNGLMSPEEYAKDVLVSGGAGLTQSIASMAAAGGIEKILMKTGNQTAFLDFVRNLTAASTGSAARIGFEYGFEDKNPTATFRSNYLSTHAGATEEDVRRAYEASLRQKAAIQFGTSFCFSLLSSYRSTLETNKRMSAYLENEFDQLERDMESLGNMRISEGEIGSWKQSVNDRTNRLRNTLSENYFAGQQDKVNAMMELLDEIDDRADMAYNNIMGAGEAEASSSNTPPSQGFVDAIGAAVRQGAEEARTVSAPPASTADMLSEIANTPMPASDELNMTVDELNDALNSPFAVFDADEARAAEEERRINEAVDNINMEVDNRRWQAEQNRKRQRQIEKGIPAQTTAPTTDRIAPTTETAAPTIDIEAEAAARRQQNAANLQRRQEIEEGIPAPAPAPSTEELLQEIANTEASPVATSQQQPEAPAQENRTPAPERETDETERETAPAVSPSSAAPSTDELASIFPEGAAEVYKKYADGADDIVSYHDNMLKAYQAGTKEQSLQNLMLNDEDFEDFWFSHEDAVEDIYRQGYLSKVQRDNENRIEEAQAPLNEAPAEGKIEETEPSTPAPRTEFATAEASQLSSDLFQRKRVDQNGFRYSVRGDDGQFFGSIERIGEGIVRNARDTVYTVGPKATIQEVADDLAAVAENNRFLEVDNGEIRGADRDGSDGTADGYTPGGIVQVAGETAEGGDQGTGETRPDGLRGVGTDGQAEPPVPGLQSGGNVDGTEQRPGEGSRGTGVRRQDRPVGGERQGIGSGDRQTLGTVSGSDQNTSEQQRASEMDSEQHAEGNVGDGLSPAAREKVEEGVPESAATPVSERSADTQAEVEASRAADIPPKGTNFVIPQEGLKLPNGEKARFKANVAAIKTLRTLMADSRQATPEEQAVLSKYVGWGGLKNAFNEKDANWSKEFKQLKSLLSDEEYKTARGSVLNAHYTDVGVIRAIYNGLKNMGFTGGRILEPAAGVGHFAGAMPSDIRVQSLTMVELDNITGNIAKYLYPNADVRVQGFETANLPDNYMDLAISNVPFGNYGVFDKAYPKAVTGAIHNYFFAKSLDKVRPGGLVCFITSRYTMDARESAVRDYIMKMADLVGAIRLPDSAFKSNAGTDVVTDILVLKKREAGTPYSGEAFKNTDYYHQSMGIWEQTNEYFQAHPDMVLGEASKTGTMYRNNSLTYKALPGKLNSQIEKAFSKITAKIDYPSKQSQADVMRQNRNEIRRASGTAKNGSYVKSNGQLYKNENGSLVETGLKAKEADIIGASVDIRDMARELLNLQMNNGDTKEIVTLRKKLNTAYDNFVSKYGPLHSRTNSRLISGDSDSPFIFALENYNSDTKKAEKADIFLKNTVTPHRIVEHVENMADGLAASINDSGTVDIPLISRVTGKTEAETTKELINQKLAFKTKDGTLQSAQQYLSGNVRAKLKEARALATIDPDFKKNVEELEKVVPKDIEPADISVKPGATWIPPDLYADFAAEMLGTTNQGWRKTIEVTYVPAAGVYKVAYGPGGRYVKGNSFDVSEYGTADKSFVQIFEAALNNKDLKVYFPHGKDEKAVINRKATIAVKEKKNKIIQKFQEWMWSDDERVKTYAPLYNDMFNNSATPNYDGSKLVIDGLSTKIHLMEHQANAVQRIIMSGGNTLLAHGTGSGKTLEMASAAMKLRQIGAVRKPLFVVPKNLVGQWANEFYKYYPSAKVLIPGEKDFTPKNRKQFVNKITTGDWDAVIISQEQFYMIPMSPEAQKDFYQRQIDEILVAQEAARESEGKKSFTVSALEKKRKTLETKLQKLDSGKRDIDNINFESTGIDSLFVDEAHAYKNLFYSTQLQNVGDLGDSNGSERAFDLYTKVKYLQSVNGGRGIVFGTATPIMNSVVEMYSMQRYLQGDLLEQKGISNFDAWVNEFGDVQEIQKIKNGGDGYETKTSLARYRNLGELQQMFRGFADVVTNPPGLADKLPKLRTGAPIVVECEPTDVQREYLKELGKRSEAVRHSRDLKEDNILKIYSDGKKMSYTQRMIDSSLPYEEGGKIMKCVENVLKEYKASSAVKGTQLVFCDTGVEGSKAKEPLPLWRDIKNMLIAGGIPEKEIAFKQSGMTDAQKDILQKKVVDGDVRVLIGSTGTMGTGLNVQKRLFAMHEVNAPDRPGDVEQNRGRIVRQGNDNKEVAIYTYITKETFDSRQWDNLKRKSAFIHQAMAGDVAGRTVDGDGDFSMSAAEISALASGNPLIIEQNEVSTKIGQLEALESEHIKQISAANRKIAELPRQIEQLQNRIADYTKDAKAMPDLSGDKFSVSIAGKEYTKRADAGKAIISEVKGFFSIGDEGAVKKIGTVGSFDLMISNKGNAFLKGNAQYDFSVNMESPEGTARSLTNAASMPKTRLDNAKAELSKNQSELTRYQEIAKKKFEHEEELNTLRNREAEIMEELNPSNERGVDYVDDGVQNMVSSGPDVKNAASSAQSYSSQWEATRVGDAEKAPMPISDIISKMRHDFGFNLTIGYVRGKGVQGTFNQQDKGLRTRIANNLPTVAHEFGHWLDDRYGITNHVNITPQIHRELEAAYQKTLGKSGANYRADQISGEGMAEFVREYLQNRETAAIEYPELTKHVLGNLTPEDLAKLTTFADEINAYYSLDADSAASSIRLKEQGNPDFRTRTEKLQDANDRFQQAWVDSNYAIKQFQKEMGGDAYTLATNAAYTDAVAERILDGDLTDIHGRYVGPGLGAALHGIDTKNKDEYIAFNEYLIVRHGPEWLADGKMVFADDRKNSTQWMERRQSELESQYPEFEAAAERLYEFIKNMTQTWGVDTGLISQETIDSLNKKYPNYVPFNRAVPIKRRGRGAGRGFANQAGPLKAARGSGLDFIAPVDNVIDMVVTYTNIASKNRVMQAMRDAAIRHGDATWMEKVPMPVQKQTFDLRGMKGRLSESADQALIQGEIDSGSWTFAGALIDQINDQMVKYVEGRPKNDVVTVLVNGEKEFWKINDPMLLESVTNLSKPTLNGFLEVYARFSRFLTMNLTGNNPIWGISNLIRDYGTYSNYTPNKNLVTRLAGIGETYVNAWKEFRGQDIDPVYYEYLAMGGGTGSAYTADINLAERVRNEFGRGFWQRTWTKYNPVAFISFLMDTIEQGPRFATYKYCRTEMGMSAEEALYASKDVTVNFRKFGTMGRQMNALMPFSNAAVQGADKMVRYFTADDVAGGRQARANVAAGRWARWIAGSMIAALIPYMLNNRDEEAEEAYGRLSNYTKNNYFCFYLGDEKFLTLPKPRELAAITTGIERTIDSTKGDEFAFAEFDEYLADAILPDVASDIAQIPGDALNKKQGLNQALNNGVFQVLGDFGIAGVGVQIASNKDFLGRPIVSQKYDGYLSKDQYNDKTSKMAYWIGQGLGLSPMQTDHFAKNTLGYMWKIPSALFPVNPENADMTLGMKNSYVRDSLHSNDIVNRMYDDADFSARDSKSNPDDGEKTLIGQLDANKVTFYNNFSKLEREAGEDRNALKDVLRMIDAYQRAPEGKATNQTEELVYNLVRQNNDKDLLPGVMKTKMKDSGGKEHVLTPAQYVRFQKEYESQYWKNVEKYVYTGADEKEQATLIEHAKALAAQQATKYALGMVNAEYKVEKSSELAYIEAGGSSLSNYNDFVEAKKEGKQDGAVDYLKNSNLSESERQALFSLYYKLESTKGGEVTDPLGNYKDKMK